MCENRERLIGYVYDECDPAERAEIEAHLESCHTCRREIRGLKGVRQDLLAWDVPANEPDLAADGVAASGVFVASGARVGAGGRGLRHLHGRRRWRCRDLCIDAADRSRRRSGADDKHADGDGSRHADRTGGAREQGAGPNARRARHARASGVW